MASLRKPSGDTSLDATLIENLRGLPRMVPVGRPVEKSTPGRYDFTGTAEVSIPHTLGEIPDFFLSNQWTDFRVFKGVTAWTDKEITLRASAAGTATLFVGKL